MPRRKPRAKIGTLLRRELVLAGMVMAGALASNQIAFAQQPEFEVASVKHGDPGRIGSSWRGGPGTSDPGTFAAENATLATLAMHAYGTKNEYELEWKSPWMATEHYDIAAKVPAGTTVGQFGLMLQRLLEERFGLVVHRETRQVPGYRLVVTEKGAKLRKSPEAPPVSSQPSIVMRNGIPQYSDTAPSGTLLTLTAAIIRGRHENMRGLAGQLILRLGAPVIDATGLEGEYDYDLSFTPEPRQGPGAIILPPEALEAPPQQVAPVNPDSHPTLRTALQEQLGLKLEAVKSVPVEVVVLDKANREPAVN